MNENQPMLASVAYTELKEYVGEDLKTPHNGIYRMKGLRLVGDYVHVQLEGTEITGQYDPTNFLRMVANDYQRARGVPHGNH